MPSVMVYRDAESAPPVENRGWTECSVGIAPNLRERGDDRRGNEILARPHASLRRGLVSDQFDTDGGRRYRAWMETKGETAGETGRGVVAAAKTNNRRQEGLKGRLVHAR